MAPPPNSLTPQMTCVHTCTQVHCKTIQVRKNSPPPQEAEHGIKLDVFIQKYSRMQMCMLHDVVGKEKIVKNKFFHYPAWEFGSGNMNLSYASYLVILKRSKLNKLVLSACKESRLQLVACSPT